MNKRDLFFVVLLILLIPAWTMIDRIFIKPNYPEAPKAVPTATPAAVTAVEAAGNTNAAVAALQGTVQPALAAVEERAVSLPDAPEQAVVLSNGVMTLRLTNLGAGIARVILHDFDATLADKLEGTGARKELDFSGNPALVYRIAGLDRLSGFQMVSSDRNQAVFSRQLSEGVTLTRTVTLAGGYEVSVTDVWTNQGGKQVVIPDQPIWLGKMSALADVSQKFGPYLGVDASHGPEIGARHHVKQIAKSVKRAAGPEVAVQLDEKFMGTSIDWFTAKNKFFIQVLSIPEDVLPVAKDLQIEAGKNPNSKLPVSVSSGVSLGGFVLAPGGDATRELSYYVGPMHMDRLHDLGMGQQEAMDFRLWAIFQPVGTVLMSGLNMIQSVIPNYGIAIILLTIVVRMVFWPLTHKGTASMKKMQELAPEIKEIREKYKKEPQKMNQKMAEFYKTHKVNPMAGCMPMFVQIPVFIALYGMLRVAVELRFAEFLWVRDLSEPENIMGWLNVLPLTMAGTMFLQQRMMPQTGDEMQRKIMMMMPLMILVFCYSMPAGLLLYWTTSNVISIFQTRVTHNKIDAEKASGASSAAGKAKEGKPEKGKKSKGGK